MAVGQTYLASNLLVGQSARALISNQSPDESLTLILTVASIPATSQAKVRLIVRDPFQPADSRPILDVFAEAGIKKVKIEPVAQVLEVTVTSLLGPVAVSVVESIESIQTSGVASKFQVVTVSGAATTIDLELSSSVHVILGASTTITLLHPRDGGKYLFWVHQLNNFTVTLPAPNVTDGVLWRAKTPPTITVGVGEVDLISLVYDLTDRRYGGVYDQDLG